MAKLYDPDLYEGDFYRWACDQAERFRALDDNTLRTKIWVDDNTLDDKTKEYKPIGSITDKLRELGKETDWTRTIRNWNWESPRYYTIGDYLDITNIVEELEGLARSERRAVHNNLVQALAHLLVIVWSASDEPRKKWEGEVATHLVNAANAYSEGMRQHLDVERIWKQAQRIANEKLFEYDETRLPRDVDCPFSLDELISDDFDDVEARDRMRRALAYRDDPHA